MRDPDNLKEDAQEAFVFAYPKLVQQVKNYLLHPQQLAKT